MMLKEREIDMQYAPSMAHFRNSSYLDRQKFLEEIDKVLKIKADQSSQSINNIYRNKSVMFSWSDDGGISEILKINL